MFRKMCNTKLNLHDNENLYDMHRSVLEKGKKTIRKQAQIEGNYAGRAEREQIFQGNSSFHLIMTGQRL